MWSLSALLLCSLPRLAVSQDASGTPGCDALCQAAFQGAYDHESMFWVSQNFSDDSFYETPESAESAHAGALLRWEDIDPARLSTNWKIPGGMSLSRFLYMSEDIDGNPIPASAFALLPYASTSPDGLFRTLVWTHGTAGLARKCAPTNHQSLYYEWEGPFALVQAGYAVIAPDYAGLGSDIPQGFMYESGFLHAADVAFGLIAAREAIGELLTDEWVVIGHSEGGMTAWRVNERLAMPGQDELLKAGTFLGAVAGAPALRPLDLIPESFKRAAGGPVGDAVSIYFLQSLSRLYPDQIRVEDYVSDIVAARIPFADEACLISGFTLFSNLTQSELYKDISWLQHPAVIDWQERYNGAGPHPLAAPMLVVQGLGDLLTYASATERDFNLTCATYPDSQARLLLYPELNHGVSFHAAQVDYFPWINDRFNGVAADVGCSSATVKPATNRFAKMYLTWASSGSLP